MNRRKARTASDPYCLTMAFIKVNDTIILYDIPVLIRSVVGNSMTTSCAEQNEKKRAQAKNDQKKWHELKICTQLSKHVRYAVKQVFVIKIHKCAPSFTLITRDPGKP